MHLPLKTLCLAILTVTLASCGQNARKNDPKPGAAAERHADVSISTDEGHEIFEGGHICVSGDNRVTIESGIIPAGGTAPDFWTKWTIVDDEGVRHELKSQYTAYISDVHALRKTDGTTYYIVDCYAKASSAEAAEWLEAYEIAGDTIKAVNIIDGRESALPADAGYGIGVPEEFYIDYDIPSWYFATNGSGYDWLFEYDARSGELYVPLTDEYVILDRYMVWKFNGDRFVAIGERPHKDMHKSLSDYNRLIRFFTTKDYIIRVDSLNSGELRYASWQKPKTMSDTPDIILRGGIRRCHPVPSNELPRCDDFLFTNGDYAYIVNYCQTRRSESGYGEHHDYLLIKKGDETLLMQEQI